VRDPSPSPPRACSSSSTRSSAPGVTRHPTARRRVRLTAVARRAPRSHRGVHAGRGRPDGAAGSCRARHLGRGHRARPALLRRRGLRAARARGRAEHRGARRADPDGRHPAHGLRPRPGAARGRGRAHDPRRRPCGARVRGGHGAVPAQFFADPAVRIAHGVLLAIGCVLLASRVEERATASAG
jgi:hypothetical protein